eukprot:TRINITY_DN29401_c0_g1_i1.p3 TRINITY_DN29401_c0_g1~~TRINITY_DN29401_c0_g1_i1.p3  ORF type:complete len:119 (+),score=9.21 TRINITY_DN29401_c0_g1_i1:149-505(+)
MKWLDLLSGWLILAAGSLLLLGCAGVAPVERGANDENALSPAQSQQEITQFVSSYRLGSGDVLSVRVFGRQYTKRVATLEVIQIQAKRKKKKKKKKEIWLDTVTKKKITHPKKNTVQN